MAENTKKPDEGKTAETATPGQHGPEPAIQIVTQYVKDLSFENPGVGMPVQRPQIVFIVNLEARRAGTEQFEVVLKLRVNASQEDKPIFLLELAYGALFLIRNIPEDSLQPVLFIECPRLIFPFARRLVADMVRDGGLPPLLIDPIDFAALYRAKLAEGAGARSMVV